MVHPRASQITKIPVGSSDRIPPCARAEQDEDPERRMLRGDSSKPFLGVLRCVRHGLIVADDRAFESRALSPRPGRREIKGTHREDGAWYLPDGGLASRFSPRD